MQRARALIESDLANSTIKTKAMRKISIYQGIDPCLRPTPYDQYPDPPICNSVEIGDWIST